MAEWKFEPWSYLLSHQRPLFPTKLPQPDLSKLKVGTQLKSFNGSLWFRQDSNISKRFRWKYLIIIFMTFLLLLMGVLKSCLFKRLFTVKPLAWLLSGQIENFKNRKLFLFELKYKYKGHVSKIFVFFPAPKYMIWSPIWKAQTICSLTLMVSFLYLLYSWRYSSFTETPQISLFLKTIFILPLDFEFFT